MLLGKHSAKMEISKELLDSSSDKREDTTMKLAHIVLGILLSGCSATTAPPPTAPVSPPLPIIAGLKDDSVQIQIEWPPLPPAGFSTPQEIYARNMAAIDLASKGERAFPPAAKAEAKVREGCALHNRTPSTELSRRCISSYSGVPGYSFCRVYHILFACVETKQTGNQTSSENSTDNGQKSLTN